jgi:choline-glycine betaine transporter
LLPIEARDAQQGKRGAIARSGVSRLTNVLLAIFVLGSVVIFVLGSVIVTAAAIGIRSGLSRLPKWVWLAIFVLASVIVLAAVIGPTLYADWVITENCRRNIRLCP